MPRPRQPAVGVMRGIRILLLVAFLMTLVKNKTYAEEVAVAQRDSDFEWVDPRVNATCDNVTEFACSNAKCIPIGKFNNTVNDCEDNSDEVDQDRMCRYPMFTCRNFQCTLLRFILDGTDDCHDGTDEAKIIGTDCSMVKPACCQCDQYINNSECRTENNKKTCQCISGYYSNPLGTDCIRRRPGDPCVSDPDCYNAFQNSSCVSGFCGCDVGYYVSKDGSQCTRRYVGDNCSADADCTAVIPNSNCSSAICQCDSGYYQSPDKSTCVLRKIGETCRLDHHCAGIPHSDCNESGQCTCLRGYRIEGNNTVCQLKLIGELCQENPDCAVIGSYCETSACACALGRYPARNLDYCHLRALRSHCQDHGDCYYAVNRSSCFHGYCKCDLGYRDRFGDNSTCYESYPPSDVAQIAIAIFLISFLVLIISAILLWLVVTYCRLWPHTFTKETV